ncbi:PrsW family intramembrane metalloprotease, partial [Limosilactobacillus equigenerosi]
MEKIYCTNCGAVNWSNANFCINCGQPLIKVHANQTNTIPFRVRDLFSEVFKRHSREEAEELLIAGTAKTTPAIETLEPFKLRPWLFSRALVFTLFLAVLLGILTSINGRIGNVVALDAVIAISVPVSALVLFFEINIYRNLSLYQIIQIFLVGGLLAIIVTVMLDYVVGNQGPQNLMGAFETGITEEIGKLIVAAYFVSRLRTKRILEGLLIGAAVGAGFAAFENIMYMVNDQTGALASTNIALLRALISIGGHTEWC